jgi:hypothetical protein
VAEKGILSTPDVKPGKLLPAAITEMVKLFHVSYIISSIIQRTKDCVLVNSKAKKVHLQKQVILHNQRES